MENQKGISPMVNAKAGGPSENHQAGSLVVNQQVVT
jgi:hypothetical protein